jgi:uncharacterized coiled-coil protein SlyX
MSDIEALRARVKAQKETIDSLRATISDLQSSQASLKEQIVELVRKTKALDDEATAPVLSAIARLKSEQKSVSESQVALRRFLEEQLAGFRKSLQIELAAVYRAASANLKATAAAASESVAVELEKAAHETAVIAEGHSVTSAAPDSPLEGLLVALARQVGRNPALSRDIIATASTALDEDRLGPQNAADPKSDTNFVSKNQPDSWLQYDFKGRKVKITHYTIRSRFDGFKGSNNPKSWIVLVSTDGKSWTEIDRRSENDELNAKNAAVVFKVDGDPPEARFVRLQQTGPAHSGKNFLALSAFELFGSLYS